MLSIKGIQKTTLVDYPGKVAATIFVGGCNFRCPFCQNPDLVLSPDKVETIPIEQALLFLKEKKKWLDAVCITGGEPTLFPGLVDFIQAVKKKGYLVKLDTNGSNPGLVKELIDAKLVDYIAVDIKTAPSKYNIGSGSVFDISKLDRTKELVIGSGIDYEFRTTVVPGIVAEKDIREITEYLKGAKAYALQQFNNKVKMIDNSFMKVEPYPMKELEKFKKIAGEKIKNVRIVNG